METERERTKKLPPSHCGKAECMIACCCSKEALKYSSCGSRRVNISAAVGARIMGDTQRGMAAEERKFSNTVVVTADKDTVMLGGRGTRRERKIPERYKNSQHSDAGHIGQRVLRPEGVERRE